MRFRNQNADQPLLGELKNHSVVLPKEWDALDLPEDGDLTEALASNASRIDSRRWIYWMVKCHDFTRIPNPEPREELLAGLMWKHDMIRKTDFFGTYPLIKRGNLAYVVSIRPDISEVLESFRDWLNVSRFILLVLTPTELTTWRKFVKIYH